MIGWPPLNDVGKKPPWLMTGQKREKFQARVPGDSLQDGMGRERAGNSLFKKTRGMLGIDERGQPEMRNMKEIKALASRWQAWKSE